MYSSLNTLKHKKQIRRYSTTIKCEKWKRNNKAKRRTRKRGMALTGLPNEVTKTVPVCTKSKIQTFRSLQIKGVIRVCALGVQLPYSHALFTRLPRLSKALSATRSFTLRTRLFWESFTSIIRPNLHSFLGSSGSFTKTTLPTAKLRRGLLHLERDWRWFK